MSERFLVSLAAIAVIALVPLRSGAQDWARFRGPNGAGLSEAESIPAQWTEKDYNWKIKVPGIGHSQPVVWNERLFVTTAADSGARRVVLALAAGDGSRIWERSFESRSHEKHLRNSYASATPCADAERLYAAFAHPDEYTVVALDHGGDEAWRRDLGRFTSRHGHALSPILFEDLVIIGKEQGRDSPESAESFLVALDRRTGEVRWKTPRQTDLVSYSTPCIYRDAKGRPRLVANSKAHGITALDPQTGTPVWWADCFKMRTVASPIVAGDLVLGTCGSGGGGNYLVAVRTSGTGDVSTTHEAYRVTEAASYVPTPLVKGDRIYMFADNGGIVSCLEASTGRLIWRQRIDKNLSFSGSPVCVQDRIYCISHDGTVVVVAAQDEFRLLARNELGAPSRCTPAVAGGRMYLRTFDEEGGYGHLISIGGKELAQP